MSQTVTILHVLAMWLFLGVVFVALVLVGAARGPWNYFWFFTMFCWMARDNYWVAAAEGVKPDTPMSRWGAFTSLSIYVLYCLPLDSVPMLGQRVIPNSLVLHWTGALFCAFGVGLTIWARYVLARSWRPCWMEAVPLQEGHKLVQTGPYGIVRHPIYLGMLLAASGMVIVLGEVRALVLLFGIELLLKRIGKEEAVLRTSFPDEYHAYERRVRRLVPGIW
jgi:protein-S-isoprenylcysteine O-methyltransferase Ste14